MTQHSAASHRARVRKQEGDALREALELETSKHEETYANLVRVADKLTAVSDQLAEERANLVLCRATIKSMRADSEDGRQLRADLISMLKRHGVEV